MRLHRFYVTAPIYSDRDNSLVDADLLHQFRRVFRFQSGDQVIFFDGSGEEHVAAIVSMTKDTIAYRVLETKKSSIVARKKVLIAMSLIKKDNIEWVIQKDTELGAAGFIPLVSERSEKRSFNMERARKIMIEACEQSGRSDIPTIAEPISFDDLLTTGKGTMIAFHTEGASFDPKEFSGADEIVACIGPEGGWTDAEIERFREAGAKIRKLDAPVLRAETAAVAIATLLLIGETAR